MTRLLTGITDFSSFYYIDSIVKHQLINNTILGEFFTFEDMTMDHGQQTTDLVLSCNELYSNPAINILAFNEKLNHLFEWNPEGMTFCFLCTTS